MIRVGFSTKRYSPFSMLIRWLTGSKASHAWLVLHDECLGLEVVLEATVAGLHLVPFDHFQTRNEIVAILTPKKPLDEGLRYVTPAIGRPYNYTGILGIALVLVGRWLRQKWRNPFRSTKALFCSETVVWVLQAARYPGAEELDPASTTPQDLYDFMSVP